MKRERTACRLEWLVHWNSDEMKSATVQRHDSMK